MVDNLGTIGERLRQFANEVGGVTKLAELLNIKPPSLYDYLNDKSVPGGLFLRELNNLGCDINWLLTGQTIEEKGKPTSPDYRDKIKKLEEENRLLRDRISQISQLTQAVETIKKVKRPRKL